MRLKLLDEKLRCFNKYDLDLNCDLKFNQASPSEFIHSFQTLNQEVPPNHKLIAINVSQNYND